MLCGHRLTGDVCWVSLDTDRVTALFSNLPSAFVIFFLGIASCGTLSPCRRRHSTSQGEVLLFIPLTNSFCFTDAVTLTVASPSAVATAGRYYSRVISSLLSDLAEITQRLYHHGSSTVARFASKKGFNARPLRILPRFQMSHTHHLPHIVARRNRYLMTFVADFPPRCINTVSRAEYIVSLVPGDDTYPSNSVNIVLIMN